MKRFKASAGANFNDKQAQRYGEALEALERRLGHPPTTDEIVDDAKDPDSPLHDGIEWNVKKAARNYWRVQARHIASHIEEFVVVRNKELPMRSWFNVKPHPEEPRRYVRADRIADSPYMRGQIIQHAIRELNDWSVKYRRYREFRPIRAAIKRISGKVKNGSKAE